MGHYTAPDHWRENKLKAVGWGMPSSTLNNKGMGIHWKSVDKAPMLSTLGARIEALPSRPIFVEAPQEMGCLLQSPLGMYPLPENTFAFGSQSGTFSCILSRNFYSRAAWCLLPMQRSCRPQNPI